MIAYGVRHREMQAFERMMCGSRGSQSATSWFPTKQVFHIVYSFHFLSFTHMYCIMIYDDLCKLIYIYIHLETEREIYIYIYTCEHILFITYTWLGPMFCWHHQKPSFVPTPPASFCRITALRGAMTPAPWRTCQRCWRCCDSACCDSATKQICRLVTPFTSYSP